jgi:high mobility group protein B1
MQTYLEEQKKQHPDPSVTFSEFSKKCSERWKSMSAKQKGKCEDMAKADKALHKREVKAYASKGRQKEAQGSQCTRGLLRPSSCSVLSIAPNQRGTS